jgi:catechol 2,3-dioxygenase
MSQTRPEIGAQLDHLCLRSPDPRRLARFLENVYAMKVSDIADAMLLCAAPQRRVLVEAGRINTTGFVSYSFPRRDALGRYREMLVERGLRLDPGPSPLFDQGAFSLADPDGNTIVFGTRTGAATEGGAAMPARLQHVVFRSANPEAMVDFYERRLGFVVSDRVKDGAGELRACFMRTDTEHHSLAVFHSPETRLDHHSYETLDWEYIRRWADDVGAKRIAIFWGVGRHGPGNDLFFMVKDPDDNLVEISAEIEQCAADRPTGVWPHEERTLNLWGNSIMRS